VIVKSKITSCRGCSLNMDSYCHWFNIPKSIPYETMNKGCKYRIGKCNSIYTTETVVRIIEKFNGEIIDEKI
jgi:hypothetical protein|tara:strand:+ start:2725 stop:2940 length:216 start_codon:yes stop_codon:yes gene_type:complete